MALERVGRDATTGRDLYVAEVRDVREWPDEIRLPTPHFVVVTAFDAESLELEVLKQFAAKLLRQGCVYACAWGRDCEKVHLAVDLAAVEAEAAAGDSDDVVMTTWHANESLDEALYFAIFDAWPSASYEASTGAVVAIVEPPVRAIVESRLADTRALARDVLASNGEAPST